jgi:hypothetical protein
MIGQGDNGMLVMLEAIMAIDMLPQHPEAFCRT